MPVEPDTGSTITRGDVGSVVQGRQSLEVFRQFAAPARLAAAEGHIRQAVGWRIWSTPGSSTALKTLRLAGMPPTDMPPKFTP